MAAVPENPWFRPPRYYHWYRFGPGELAFLSELRKCTATWTLPETENEVLRNEDEAALVAVAYVSDPERGAGLATFGVHMAGPTVRGDLVSGHSYAMYYLPKEPTGLAMEATGNSRVLAEAAAAWFESVLQKPVVRHEWECDGQIYARLYEFADTGQGLAGMYNEDLAPHEVTESLLTHNHGANHSWVDVGELGRFVDPTRTVQVWGRPLA
ncbi:hypothetical protein Kpho01_76370 [Kitasatospora phosalacinea]|uniref:Uncharacterized protein n=1 Tax=Kitasatospora phosalacinea TaxID=2065 RepID=A0A9W6PQW2_9ACTN|nr:hypothetical protein Kpho01_76370 [Kitasatospora phosalacinea]